MTFNSKINILVIEDNFGICNMIARILTNSGYPANTAYDGASGIETYKKELPDLIILDINLPDISGIEILKQIKLMNKEIPIIIVSAQEDVKLAVDAIKFGAYDYIKKPFSNDDILLAVKRAIQENAMRQEIFVLKTQLKESMPLSEQMGYSEVIEKLNEQINCVAPTNFTVIIFGETGSGKELVSRCIHQRSARGSKPFVVVDCSSIPDTLVESELFGHEKGSFTGAHLKKIGRFEHASGGTIFLDEIGNLPWSTQSKLLRIVEEKRITPIGSNKEIEVDVRIVAAGNERLESLVEAGRFRMDLYQRLNEFFIEIPPLRQRKGDVEFLCNKFISLTNNELNKNIRAITKEALEILLSYDWPGNVRELKNVISRAVLLAEVFIEPKHLIIDKRYLGSITTVEVINNKPDFIHQQTGENAFSKDFAMNFDENQSLRNMVNKCIEDAEKKFITETLKKTRGNKRQAAKILNINYKTMYYKVKKYGICSRDYSL
ncbi:MAG: sigma-54-dependent Fis family transcriptional regulator [Candidatus Kuenenia sp.]|nr:sigma-54-dependent Fis family transcriptional regulator [Candidatus Kuenenia hertensis]